MSFDTSHISSWSVRGHIPKTDTIELAPNRSHQKQTQPDSNANLTREPWQGSQSYRSSGNTE
eukprot:3148832-Amphidinium_carterae.1